MLKPRICESLLRMGSYRHVMKFVKKSGEERIEVTHGGGMRR